MRIVNKYTPCPGQRVRIVNKCNMEEYVAYPGVLYITEEVNHEGDRYIVLHFRNDEAASFNMAEWCVAVSAYVRLW